MADLSIIQKISLFFETIVSTSFFSIYAIFGVILLILMLIDIRKHKKINRIVYILGILFLLTFVIIKYFNIIIKICDVFIEIIIKALYFPNLGMYIFMLIISNLTFLIFFFSKNTFKNYKMISGICNGLIDFLFIMIIGIISKVKIDISMDVELYSNPTILTLLQLSMILFAIMYVMIFIIKVHNRLKSYDINIIFDKESYPKMGIYVKNDNTKGKFSDSNIKKIKVLNFKKNDAVK